MEGRSGGSQTVVRHGEDEALLHGLSILDRPHREPPRIATAGGRASWDRARDGGALAWLWSWNAAGRPRSWRATSFDVRFGDRDAK